MRPDQAWIHAFDAAAARNAARLGTELQSRGLRLEALDPSSPAHLGIALYDKVSSGLCEFIHRVSGGGRRRVLLIGDGVQSHDQWPLLRAGASDVLTPGGEPGQLADTALAFLERWSAIDDLLTAPEIQNLCIGESHVWLQILRQVIEVARFTSAGVLITGESGTGKELIARLIHELDQRPKRGELVLVDCTTIVPTLSGSEFFGHVRGAFTGAATDREGAFSLADGGTLFLDEVGELPPTLQAELLRVVQEGTYKRVGSNTWHRTNFRLVCATNRDLAEDERAGRFRRDLFHRIAGWSCHLPPLRQRVEDILPLTRHFMRLARSGQPPPDLAPLVQDYLLGHTYPGNVRELKHLVARMMLRYCGMGSLTPGCIPDGERPDSHDRDAAWWAEDLGVAIRKAVTAGVPLKEIGRVAESQAVTVAISESAGNLQQAAARLGVTDRALQMRVAAQRRAIEGNGALHPN